jgi:acyl-CoA hydrolase
VRGAYASRGRKSIIACHSTAAKGKVSRIVARLDGPQRKVVDGARQGFDRLGTPRVPGRTHRGAKEMHLL